jgi:hypothetical protein
MPGFFSAVHRTNTAAPFTPYNWSTYNSNMLWRIDMNNTACYPGTGTSLTSLGPTSVPWVTSGSPTFTTVGNASFFQYDGVTSSADGINTTGNFTYWIFSNYQVVWGAWVWHDTASSARRMIFGIDDNGSTDLIYFGVNVNALGTDYAVMAFLNSISSPTYTTSILPNTWNFLCFHHDIFNQKLTVYKNGSSVYSSGGNGSIPAINVSAERYVMGGGNASGTSVTTDFWLGRISEAFLYTLRVVEQYDASTLVSDIYNGTKGRYGL